MACVPEAIRITSEKKCQLKSSAASITALSWQRKLVRDAMGEIMRRGAQQGMG